MPQANSTTLIMLLSTAKLQRGQMGESGFDKRWQTPEDVLAQTREAVNHLRASGRVIAKVVFLYTDTLYLNSPDPGIKLIQNSQDRTLTHRRKLQALLAEDKQDVPIVEMLWGELVQGQRDYQSPRTKLIQAYETRNEFRAAVQNDNPKRKGETDLIPQGSKKGSAPTEADMFVLEEIGLFDGLAKGYITSDKIDPNTDIVMAYPGVLMQSLQALQDMKLNIHKGNSSHPPHQAMKASWLDVSDPAKAMEQEFHSSTPHPEAVKKHREQARTARKHRLFKRAYQIAASLLVAAGATIAALVFNKPNADNVNPSIVENDYQAAVSFTQGADDRVTVTFKKDSKDQPAQLWTASQVRKGEKDAGRNLIFRDDVAYIQNATKVLALLGKIDKTSER